MQKLPTCPTTYGIIAQPHSFVQIPLNLRTHCHDITTQTTTSRSGARCHPAQTRLLDNLMDQRQRHHGLVAEDTHIQERRGRKCVQSQLRKGFAPCSSTFRFLAFSPPPSSVPGAAPDSLPWPAPAWAARPRPACRRCRSRALAVPAASARPLSPRQ